MTASALHFLLLNGLATAAAWFGACACFRDREAWRRPLAAAVGFGVVVEVTTLVLGTTVGLRPAALEVFLAFVAALLLLAARRSRGGGGAPEIVPARAEGAPGARLAVAAALLCAAAGIWAGVSLFDGTRFTIDDFTYHAAVPARWLAEGRIHLVPFSYQAYYPQNAELLSLWFLLPFRGDALASLGTLWGAAVLALATFGIARRLGASIAAGLLAAALVACSAVPILGLGGFARADVIGAAAAAAALALVGPRPSDLAFSGLALGFAIGTRVSFASLAPCILVWWLVEARSAGGRGGLARGLLLLAGGAALTAGYWYIRNAALTGNPFFPAALGPFDGPLDAATQARTRLATWIARSPGDGAQWAWIIARITAWPVPFCLVSVAGGGAAAWRLARRVDGPVPRALLALVFAVAALQVVQFPFLPFSGTYNRPDAGLEGIATRYLLLPFALGLALFTAIIERAIPRRWIFDALALATLATAAFPLVSLHGGPSLVAGGLAGAAAGVTLALRPGARAVARRPVVASAVAAAILVACLLALPGKRAATDANLFATGSGRLPVGRAWQALEALPRASRIAFFMAEPAEYTHLHPIFGRRLQHVPVPVERDGSPRLPLHRRPWRGWWSDWNGPAVPLDPARLALNLEASGVDHALVTRWTLGRWPPQRAALENLPGARKLFDDGWSALYGLR